LKIWEGKEADLQFPTRTPGKAPLAERGELGRLENLKKRHSRQGLLICLLSGSV